MIEKETAPLRNSKSQLLLFTITST
jgi:hypothetical protein